MGTSFLVLLCSQYFSLSRCLFLFLIFNFSQEPHKVLTVPLLFGTSKCCRLILYIYCPSHLSTKPSFLLVGNGGQNLSTAHSLLLGGLLPSLLWFVSPLQRASTCILFLRSHFLCHLEVALTACSCGSVGLFVWIIFSFCVAFWVVSIAVLLCLLISFCSAWSAIYPIHGIFHLSLVAFHLKSSIWVSVFLPVLLRYNLVSITHTVISLLRLYYHTEMLKVGYILHTVHFTPMTHLFCNWKFVVINQSHLFLSSSNHPPSGNHLFVLCICNCVLVFVRLFLSVIPHY